MNVDNTLNKITIDELNKRFKKLAKESIKEEHKQHTGHLQSEYRIAVNNYYRQHNLQPSPYFEYPYKYFMLKNKKIVFTWNKTIRFSLNIEKNFDSSDSQHFTEDIDANSSLQDSENDAFENEVNYTSVHLSKNFKLLNLPCSKEKEVELLLIRTLYNLLKYIPSLNFHLNEYHMRAGYPFPTHLFFTHQNNMYALYNDKPCLVQTHLLKKWYRYFPNMYKPSVSLLKQLRKSSIIATVDEQIPNYFASCLLRKREELVEYRHKNLEKPFLRLQFESEESFVINNNYVPVIDLTEIRREFPTFSTEMANFLHDLAGGNWSTLRNLSILFWNLFSIGREKAELFVIQKPSDSSNFDNDLLDILSFFDIMLFPSCTLDKLISKQMLKTLPNIKFDGFKGYYISNSGTLRDECKNQSLQKLVNSKNIAYTDTIMGKITFKNKLPLICCISSHEELVYFQNNYTCRILDFRHTDFTAVRDNLSVLVRSATSKPALLYYLVMLGEHFLRTSQKKSQKPTPIIPHDDIINSCLSLCIYSDNSKDFVYADELYNVYCYFFEKNYVAVPLKRTQFVAKLKLHSNFAYKRPHVSRNVQNKYAFCGLTLRDNWKQLIDDSTTLPHSFDKDAFIKKIFEEVNELPSFPDNLFSKRPKMSFSFVHE